MLAALTERYSNIAIGKILDVSEAAVRMMLKRAGIKRANRISTSLDDWQAVIIRAELKAEMARKDDAEWEGGCRVSQVPLDASVQVRPTRQDHGRRLNFPDTLHFLKPGSRKLCRGQIGRKKTGRRELIVEADVRERRVTISVREATGHPSLTWIKSLPHDLPDSRKVVFMVAIARSRVSRDFDVTLRRSGRFISAADQQTDHSETRHRRAVTRPRSGGGQAPGDPRR